MSWKIYVAYRTSYKMNVTEQWKLFDDLKIEEIKSVKKIVRQFYLNLIDPWLEMCQEEKENDTSRVKQ